MSTETKFIHVCKVCEVHTSDKSTLKSGQFVADSSVLYQLNFWLKTNNISAMLVFL